MIIKSIHIKKLMMFCFVLCLIILLLSLFCYHSYCILTSGVALAEESKKEEEKKDYIKWVDFKVDYEILDKTAKLDIASHTKENQIPLNWIELLAYLACKYGGNLSNYKASDLDTLVKQLQEGQSIESLTQNMKLYPYFYEAYNSILNQFIGEYEVQVVNPDGSISFQKKYGIKAFLPIAKNYSFNHYKDFGSSRSYGYNRKHLGNDLMGSIGTPIIAIESGIVEALGWNQYGGWRIGIRSFDKKRYYYYAHLRKDHPYVKDLYEGKVVKAGDVIGYLGMTGYSVKENVNNINVPHLHFGLQLIFDESQKEGVNQIWVDVYYLIEFLRKNKSEVYLEDTETKDYARKFDIIDPIVPE